MCEIYASVRSFLFSPPFFVLYLVELWTKIILLKEKKITLRFKKKDFCLKISRKRKIRKKKNSPCKKTKKIFQNKTKKYNNFCTLHNYYNYAKNATI